LPKIKIINGRVTVAGKTKYEDLPDSVKQTVEQDFADVYAIRLAGSAPVITQAGWMSCRKKHRWALNSRSL
jgi:hypothetical protein